MVAEELWTWGQQLADGLEVEAGGEKNPGQPLALGLSNWWKMGPLPEIRTMGEGHLQKTIKFSV